MNPSISWNRIICVFNEYSNPGKIIFNLFLVSFNLHAENIQVKSELAKMTYSFTIYSLKHYQAISFVLLGV